MKSSRFQFTFALPLLTKDLIEIAARRRTYILRVAAAFLLYLIGLAVLGDNLRFRGTGGYQMLGAGRELVQVLAWCLLAGVYLFLPASMASAIASERESGTLTLLLISPMRPWQIVLQKLGGRMVPVLSLLLLALPLLGVGYTLGGIVEQMVWDSVYVILVAAVQVGSIALMWSAFCRSPAASFILTYVTLAILYIVWPLLLAIANVHVEELLFFANPVVLLGMAMFGGWGGFVSVYSLSIGCWVTAGVALLLARVFLVSRQGVQRRNRVLQLVRAVDKVIDGPSPQARRAAMPATPPSPSAAAAASAARPPGPYANRALPLDRPVAWNELHRRALGRVRYLVLILLGIELPVLFISLLIYVDYASSSYRYGDIEGLSAFLLLIWPVLALTLTMVSAGLFANERKSQTLDVLLTTPLPTRQIVSQKLAGVTRLCFVLAAPLVSIVALEALYESGSENNESAGGYFLISLLAIAVYFFTLTWLSLWIGVRSRSARKAVMTAVGAVIGICVAPLILALLAGGLFWSEDLAIFFANVSPVMFVLILEFSEFDDMGNPVVITILHLGWWLLVGVIARIKVMSDADALLGRVRGSGPGV